jgi:predicted ATP-grasp superfamily ATP-dependent carboligase
MSPFRALYGYNPLIRLNVKADVLGGEALSIRARIEKLADERETLLQH